MVLMKPVIETPAKHINSKIKQILNNTIIPWFDSQCSSALLCP